MAIRQCIKILDHSKSASAFQLFHSRVSSCHNTQITVTNLASSSKLKLFSSLRKRKRTLTKRTKYLIHFQKSSWIPGGGRHYLDDEFENEFSKEGAFFEKWSSMWSTSWFWLSKPDLLHTGHVWLPLLSETQSKMFTNPWTNPSCTVLSLWPHVFSLYVFRHTWLRWHLLSRFCRRR
jgi:hypothetical protein